MLELGKDLLRWSSSRANISARTVCPVAAEIVHDDDVACFGVGRRTFST